MFLPPRTAPDTEPDPVASAPLLVGSSGHHHLRPPPPLSTNLFGQDALAATTAHRGSSTWHPLSHIHRRSASHQELPLDPKGIDNPQPQISQTLTQNLHPQWSTILSNREISKKSIDSRGVYLHMLDSRKVTKVPNKKKIHQQVHDTGCNNPNDKTLISIMCIIHI